MKECGRDSPRRSMQPKSGGEGDLACGVSPLPTSLAAAASTVQAIQARVQVRTNMRNRVTQSSSPCTNYPRCTSLANLASQFGQIAGMSAAEGAHSVWHGGAVSPFWGSRLSRCFRCVHLAFARLADSTAPDAARDRLNGTIVKTRCAAPRDPRACLNVVSAIMHSDRRPPETQCTSLCSAVESGADSGSRAADAGTSVPVLIRCVLCALIRADLAHCTCSLTLL